MPSEYQPIVDAITSLQSNPLKDYIMPVGTVVVSALLGIGATIYTNNFQDKVKSDIHKINTLNRTTFAVTEMRENLVSIKSLYHGKLDTNPIQRMLTLPPLVNTFSIPTFDPVELSFLTENIKKGNVEENKWIRVEIINTLFSNYKSLIEQWRVLSKHNFQLQTALAPHAAAGGIDNEVLYRVLGRPLIVQLTDLTEMVLKLTDELIVEMSCFLIGFPHSVKDVVKKSRRKRHGEIIAYQLPENDIGKVMLEHVPRFDVNKMSDIQSLTVKEVEERYRYTYR